MLDRDDWMTLAEARIAELIEFERRRAGRDQRGVARLPPLQLPAATRWPATGCSRSGVEPSAAFERIQRMPRFLAYGTLPWGAYELIGDTIDGPATPIPGTWAEFAATRGRVRSQAAVTRVRWFDAGYLFGRSGWGEHARVPARDGVQRPVGAAAIVHGHDDAGSLTLAAWGSRLLLTPGCTRTAAARSAPFIRSRSAHNVVTVDGVPWSVDRDVPSWSASQHVLAPVDVRVRIPGYAASSYRRRITYSRRLDYLVVEDRAGLRRGRGPTGSCGTCRADAQSDARARRWFDPPRRRATCCVRQLAGDVRQRIVVGARRRSRAGCRSRTPRSSKAPVVEAIQEGRSRALRDAGRPVALPVAAPRSSRSR